MYSSNSGPSCRPPDPLLDPVKMLSGIMMELPKHFVIGQLDLFRIQEGVRGTTTRFCFKFFLNFLIWKFFWKIKFSFWNLENLILKKFWYRLKTTNTNFQNLKILSWSKSQFCPPDGNEQNEYILAEGGGLRNTVRDCTNFLNVHIPPNKMHQNTAQSRYISRANSDTVIFSTFLEEIRMFQIIAKRGTKRILPNAPPELLHIKSYRYPMQFHLKNCMDFDFGNTVTLLTTF